MWGKSSPPPFPFAALHTNNKYETHGKRQPKPKPSRPNSSKTRHILQPLQVPSTFHLFRTSTWGFGPRRLSPGARLPDEPLLLASLPSNKDLSLPKTAALAKGSLRPLQSPDLAEVSTCCGCTSFHQSRAATSHALAGLQGTGRTRFKKWILVVLACWGVQIFLWFLSLLWTEQAQLHQHWAAGQALAAQLAQLLPLFNIDSASCKH